MTKIYFAAPLFNEAEKAYNLQLARVLEEAGYFVFLPQRDGYEAPKMPGMTEEEKAVKIFAADIAAIDESDVLFMVLDGRVPDEGACVELGYAFAKGKRCYGIRSDVRAAERGLELNPMLTGCFNAIIDCRNQPSISALTTFLSQNKLFDKEKNL